MTDVIVSGTAEVGQTLTGFYTYADAEDDIQGIHYYKWFRSDDLIGQNKVEISGATSESYTLSESDIGKYISFEVTPIASEGTITGLSVQSALIGPVENISPATATVSHGSYLPLNTFISINSGTIYENWRLTVTGDTFKSGVYPELNNTIIFGGDFSNLTSNGYSPKGNTYYDQTEGEIIIIGVSGTIGNTGQGTITIKGSLLNRGEDVVILVATN